MGLSPKIQLHNQFFVEHRDLFQTLMEKVNWEDSMSARKTASFGVPYNYSQMSYPECPIPNYLMPLALKLNEDLGCTFNNCLLNRYDSGEHTMGFHSDETSNLIDGTGVAIVSLGSAREITYKNKCDPENYHSFKLESGSMLYMDSEVQKNWLHAIKKSDVIGARISLTWRAFK